MKTKNITRMTLWANRLVFVVLVVATALLQLILDWYSDFRFLSPIERAGISAGFYCCVPVVAVALWDLERILQSILKMEVFVRENVRRASRVRWCCGVVALICVPVTVCYLPLVFVTLIMAFLCLALSVVVCTLDAAVTIREENDLTI
jgi:hypothetical protein